MYTDYVYQFNIPLLSLNLLEAKTIENYLNH